MSSEPIPVRVEPSAAPHPATPRTITREFERLLANGATIRCAGSARRDPNALLSSGYRPRHRVDLFGTRYYLTNLRQNPLLRFFIAYVVQGLDSGKPVIHPRIFYKDISLVWRSASHIVHNDEELWIGKGAVRTVEDGDYEHYHTVESTTDLPFEIQSALEECSRRAKRIPRDEAILARVLRNSPSHRIQPYDDFMAPRRRAAACKANLIHGDRPIARFTRRLDPSSLRFGRGFEPDFRDGILERSESFSSSYGGAIRRYRVLARNQRVQYLFLAAPKHVWIIPPQALTTQVSSYGVRTIDVHVDDDMCIPGYEYHFIEDPSDPDSLHSQIPEGFAGAPNAMDPDRADASAWLNRMPIVAEFRRKVLRRGR